jgi:hypothetical protein
MNKDDPVRDDGIFRGAWQLLLPRTFQSEFVSQSIHFPGKAVYCSGWWKESQTKSFRFAIDPVNLKNDDSLINSPFSKVGDL